MLSKVRAKAIWGFSVCCFRAEWASPQGPRGRVLPWAAPPPRPPPLLDVKNLPNVSLRRTQITVKAQNRRYHYQHSCFKILRINCLTTHFFFLLQTLFKKELIIFSSCYFQICFTTPGDLWEYPRGTVGGHLRALDSLFLCKLFIFCNMYLTNNE